LLLHQATLPGFRQPLLPLELRGSSLWIANKTQMLNSNLMVLLATSSAKVLADDVEYSVVQTLRAVAAKDSGIP